MMEEYSTIVRGTVIPVEVQGLITHYDENMVLDNVDFIAYPGQITVIIGGSGCGKTTLLRHALGLLTPTEGLIKLLGVDITDVSDKDLKKIRSRIGVLFQGGALFTSMTVGENVATVIRENTDLPEEIIEQMVRMKLSLVGLDEAIYKYPEELSGGMRKRAALARALASDPEVLFCDEPSAGLDPVIATELDDLLLNLKSLFDMTIVVVTHEIESIKKIADRIVMLDAGRVIIEGTLDEVANSNYPKVQDFFNRVSRREEKALSSLYAYTKGESR